MVINTQTDNADFGAMEFFILALIGRVGLRSLYELRQQVGLEPGGIRSALKTLEENQFISRSEPGKRRRRELLLTTDGNAFLNSSWPSCLREYADADAILRAAFVAWVMAEPEAAATYLNHMGQSRRDGAQKIKSEAELLKRSQMEPLSGYAWMRVSNEAHRRGAESEAFVSMSGFIKEHFKQNAIKASQSAATSE